MSQIGNKQIMADNILRLMAEKGKDRIDVCNDLGFKYSTFSEWVTGIKYPRIDKIEIMANYFGVSKSSLIEKYVPEADFTMVSAPISPNLKALSDALEQLNEEGQEKLVDYADDLVSSGKYKKSDSSQVGQKAEA